MDPLTKIPPFSPPPAPGNCHSVLCYYEFDYFLDSIYNWDDAAFVCVCEYVRVYLCRVCVPINTLHTHNPPHFLYPLICWQHWSCFHILATPHLIPPTSHKNFFLPLSVRASRLGGHLLGSSWGQERDLPSDSCDATNPQHSILFLEGLHKSVCEPTERLDHSGNQ